jgi:mitogen-activated protein kinase kinase kinase
MDLLAAALVETDHLLVYTQTYEEDGTYIIAPHSLKERPHTIRRLVTEAFQVYEIFTEEGSRLINSGELRGDEDEEEEEVPYILILSPRTQFVWNGLVLMLEVPKIDLDLEDNRCRLVADGVGNRLETAKEDFLEIFYPLETEGSEPFEPNLEPPECLFEQRAHLPAVNRELRKIARGANRLAESTVDSVHHVRRALQGAPGHQELLELWYHFASDHGQHAQKYMDQNSLHKFNRLLIKLAISWVSFICDDCDPNDRKTFRWAVNALEFALHRTRRNNILQLPDDQFEMLRQKVASCMTLLISHFDILGARSSKEKERQEELLRQRTLDARAPHHEDGGEEEEAQRTTGWLETADHILSDKRVRSFWERASSAIVELEKNRASFGVDQHMIGRVLEDRPENRSLVFLASSSSNISIRWQQGRFIGAGAFGSVYLAVNLDSGSLMAVKEIKFQELSGMPNLISQIQDELRVMEMLHHPNVVEYYGIEVHRDKVYIFEEYCQGGSLAQLLEHGRIEDEGIIQVYTLQMLEGLAYLHSQNIVHRDVKPDSAFNIARYRRSLLTIHLRRLA